MIVIEDPDTLGKICGPNDKNLKQLESLLQAEIYTKGNEIHFKLDETDKTPVFHSILEKLMLSVQQNLVPDSWMVETIYQACSSPGSLTQSSLGGDYGINIPGGRGKILPRGLNQSVYIEQMRRNDLCFAIGPAGTGKTWLAVAFALGELLSHRYRKLVLSRPVMETGENLGYLPGDLTQKLDPYLKPLFDAMEDILSPQTFRKIRDLGMYEISPLAYMRGRSLKNCIIVLDEAQNTTKEQMKMFLTRLGEGSRAIVTGDLTQIDLPDKKRSGLGHAVKLLSQLEGIGFASFVREDVIRHPLVKKIIEAYEQEHPQ